MINFGNLIPLRKEARANEIDHCIRQTCLERASRRCSYDLSRST